MPYVQLQRKSGEAQTINVKNVVAVVASSSTVDCRVVTLDDAFDVYATIGETAGKINAAITVASEDMVNLDLKLGTGGPGTVYVKPEHVVALEPAADNPSHTRVITRVETYVVEHTVQGVIDELEPPPP